MATTRITSRVAVVYMKLPENVIDMPQIARFTGPTWGPSGAGRTQVVLMLAPMNCANWDSIVDSRSRIVTLNVLQNTHNRDSIVYRDMEGLSELADVLHVDLIFASTYT